MLVVTKSVQGQQLQHFFDVNKTSVLEKKQPDLLLWEGFKSTNQSPKNLESKRLGPVKPGLETMPFQQKALFAPYFSFGISSGFMHYQGDVYSQFQFGSNITYGASLFLHFTPYLRARASFAVGSIGGNDSQSPDIERRAQNLNFRNRIQELSFTGEFDFFPFMPDKTPKGSGFIYAGFTFFKHNPQSFNEFSNSYLNLRDLTTEGQDLPGYSLTSTAIPLGIGGRFQFAKRWTVSLRGGIRLLLADYVDDVGKGNYPSLDALPSNLSRQYANRTLEPHIDLTRLTNERGVFTYTGTDGNTYRNLAGFEPGTPRGRVAGNDRLFVVQLTISTYFGKIPRLLPN
ncbi:MAG TPA: hypothetical protein DCS93_05975 [Microscillaceae bacterium]|nr:hypothetical protein [Microscillaceae bacterium]